MGHVQDMKGSLSHYNRLLYQQTMVWSTSRRPGAGPRAELLRAGAAVVAIGVGSPVARLGADWRRRREPPGRRIHASHIGVNVRRLLGRELVKGLNISTRCTCAHARAALESGVSVSRLAQAIEKFVLLSHRPIHLSPNEAGEGRPSGG